LSAPALGASLPTLSPAISFESASPSILHAVPWKQNVRAGAAVAEAPKAILPRAAKKKEPSVRAVLTSIAAYSEKLSVNAADAPSSSLKQDSDFTLPSIRRSESAPVVGLELKGRAVRSLLSPAQTLNAADPSVSPAVAAAKSPKIRGQVFWGLWNLSAAIPYLWLGLDMFSGMTWTSYPLVAYAAFNILSGTAFLLLASRMTLARRKAARNGTTMEAHLSANDLHQLDLHRRQQEKGRKVLPFISQMVDQMAYLSVDLFRAARAVLNAVGLGKRLKGAGEFFFGEKKLRPLLRPYLTPALGLLSLSLVSVGIATVEAQLTGDLFNVATGEAASGIAGSIAAFFGTPVLPALIGTVMAATLLYAVVRGVNTYYGAILDERVAHRYRGEIYKRIWDQETTYLTKTGAAVLADRSLVDPEHLQAKNLDVPLAAPYYAVYMIVGAVALTWTNLPLAAVVLAAAIPLSLFMRWAAKAYSRLGDEVRGTELEMKSLGTESFDGIKKIRTHGTVKYERNRMQDVGDRQVAIENNMVMVNSKTEIVSAISTFFSEHFIYIMGAVLMAGVGAAGMPAVFASAPTYGEIIRMALLAGLFIYGVSGLAEIVQTHATAKGKSRGVEELMHRVAPKAEVGPTDPAALPAGALSIEFEDVVVEFSDGTRGLDGATFSAEAGAVIALMGDSGGGKTTAMDLIPLTRRANEGKVLIGGIPINELDPAALRQRISYMDQADVFPGRTARELLTEWAGKPVDDKELTGALQAARAEFVLAREEGLDSILTPDTMSGGERRRFSLAGALLRESGILILDEPTRGLDPEIAEEVRASIISNIRSSGRTAILITHDLGLAEKSDQIVVLSAGKVLEQGSPAHLTAQKDGWFGSFIEKARKQAETEAEEVAEQKEREKKAPAEVEETDEAEAKPESATRTTLKSIQTFLLGHKIVRPLLKKYYRQLITGIVLIALTAFIEGGTSYALGWMLDTAYGSSGAGGSVVTPMLWWAGGLSVLFIVRSFLKWKEWPLTGFAENGFVSDLRAFVFGRLMTKRMPFYSRVRSGKLAQWLEEGVENMSLINITYRIPLAKALLTVVIASTLMAFVNWQMTLLMLPVLAAASLFSAWLGGKAFALGEKITERRTEIVSSTKEVMSGIRHYKRLGRVDEERAVFDVHSNQLRELGEKAAVIHTASDVGASSLSEMATKYGLLIMGALSVAGVLSWVGLTPGSIITMMMLASLFQVEFQGLWETWIEYTQARGSSDRVVGWIQDEADVDTSGFPALAPITGRMQMKNISYRYGDSLPMAIRDVSFEVQAGETVLIAGPSGSGKSTALGAMLGLLRPHGEGEMSLETSDGFKKLSEHNYDTFLEQIAVVDQEPTLFTGSYRFNLTYGLKRQPTDGEIAEAMSLVGVDFVLPQNLDDPIHGLSGGQRQRLNLARAVLRHPKILFLDEPTAFLDPKRNEDFWKTVSRLKNGDTSFGKPTIVIVSHNIRDVAEIADHVLTLDEGVIADDGTPEELLSKDTLFKLLWSKDGPS
ncbi:MAG: hypothetical protein COB53_10315, partial [Elusimicrobia bacterium]